VKELKHYRDMSSHRNSAATGVNYWEGKMLEAVVADECETIIDDLKVGKKGADQNNNKAAEEEAAFGLYKQAKRCLRGGAIREARDLFEHATEKGLPDALEERAWFDLKLVAFFQAFGTKGDC
jgi:hypothetical protein